MVAHEGTITVPRRMSQLRWSAQNDTEAAMTENGNHGDEKSYSVCDAYSVSRRRHGVAIKRETSGRARGDCVKQV